MIYKSKELEQQAIMQTASQMCAVAKTAPKAHGKDTIHTLTLTGEDKDLLANRMELLGEELMGEGFEKWYGRDARNVRNSQAVVLIGVENVCRGVSPCGMCGLYCCEKCKALGGKCAFSMLDLGIAVSSAVNIASLSHIDNRIMYSIGKTAENMNYIPNCSWLGIPLSASGKSIFYDRGIFHK